MSSSLKHEASQTPAGDGIQDIPEGPIITLPDGRVIVDRRGKATAPVSRFTFFGRRRHSEGQSRYYVDWVDGHFRTLIATIAAFILLDTFCTLYIVSQGGTEANPVMNWVLQRGMGWFIAVKVGIAALGTFLLAIHRHFMIAKISGGVIVVAYGLVVFYHLHLLLRIWTTTL